MPHEKALRIRNDVAFFLAVAAALTKRAPGEARNLSKRFLEIFEHIGNVANGVYTIFQSHELIDRDSAIAHN